MREFRAGLGPNVVNTAIIISPKERTGQLLQHIIIIFIDAEILLDKLLGLKSKMLGDPLYILAGKQGACGFTAVGTVQAVGTPEFRLVELLHLAIEIPWRPLFKFLEKLFMFLMFIFGPLGEPIYFLLHAAKI